jgi:hypothetical protein
VARAVRFDLIADSSRFTRGMRDAERSSKRFTDHTNRAGSAVKAAFAAFSAATVVMEMRKWVAAARDANRVAAQTGAVIESTGGAAGLSAKGFSDLAKQISKNVAVDDDLIQAGENILATFTRIKAGGPDRIFERATTAAVDMAAAMNHGEVTASGLQSANVQLGKALNDPIKGITALTRVGVTFDQQQKDQIKRFMEHGQVAKAQGVILAEVNREFGGSAAAAVTPAKRLAVTWGNMQEVLGNLLIPALDRGATIMAGALEVVDRNRTAFGLLFGVLATGAAVVGTLIVAEKIHRAVVDATRVASEAWAVVQKGLNVVLGQTTVQASAAAAAEGRQAAATTAAGTAAGTAAVAQGQLAGVTAVSGAAAGAAASRWALLGGALLKGSLIVLAVVQAYRTLTTESKKLEDTTKTTETAVNRYGLTVGLALTAHRKDAAATKDSTAATKAAGDALDVLNPKHQQAAEKIAATATKSAELTGKLKELKEGFRQQVASVRDAVSGYEGLITQSDVTTKQVIRDIRNQVSNFKTYSSDVKRLIKAGVSPAAIEELSKKGPQYVHALAVGSNRELKTYKQYWADRQREVRGSFAESMQRQYEGLVKKIREMQRAINKLRGKNVDISGTTSLHFTKTFTKVDWNNARLAAGRIATGGPISGPGTETSDSIPMWLSKGEHVWSAREVKGAGGHEAMEAMRTRARGMAIGGPVGVAQTGVAHTGVGKMMDRWGTPILAAGIKAAMAFGGGALGGLSGPGGWRWQMAALRRAFPGLALISGYRPGAITATGNRSYHAMGRAVDVPPRMDVFNFIRGSYGQKTRELIFSPAGGRQVWNGRPHMYSGITRANHWDHVHWAYDKGGRIPEDVFGQGRSGRTYGFHGGETVVPQSGGIDEDRLAKKIARELAAVWQAHPPVMSVQDLKAGINRQAGRVGQPPVFR